MNDVSCGVHILPEAGAQIGIVGDQSAGLFRCMNRVKRGGSRRLIGQRNGTDMNHFSGMEQRRRDILRAQADVCGACAVEAEGAFSVMGEMNKSQGRRMLRIDDEVTNINPVSGQSFPAQCSEKILADLADEGGRVPKGGDRSSHIGGCAADIRGIGNASILRAAGHKINEDLA